MTEVISSLKFEDLVRTETKPLLIDVYADWCGPCQRIAPTVAALTTDLEGQARIVKINIDEAREMTSDVENPLIKFLDERGIRSIPSLLLFEGGQYKGLLQGNRSKENIRGWMEQTLGHKFAAPAPKPPAPKSPAP